MPESTPNPFIEALHAGLSPIPVRAGSKVPAVQWKQYQVEPVDELTANEWHLKGYGIGLVCGQVSGRLMCLDFEAGVMDQFMEIAQRMRHAKMEAAFTSWLNGYSESTPSGGLHVLIRLQGEGPCPPNEKIARDRNGKVLIETRGEGGYVIVAPTPGWKLINGGFGTITYSTLDLISRHG